MKKNKESDIMRRCSICVLRRKKLKRLSLFFCCLFFWGTQTLFSQSNQMIDALLSASIAPLNESSLIILQAGGLLSEKATPEEAYRYLVDQKWFSDQALKRIEKRGGLTLGDASLLFMKGFALNGGIAYSIYPTPRNAAKEMESKGLFYDRERSPYTPISGTAVLTILSRLLDYQEYLKHGGKNEN